MKTPACVGIIMDGNRRWAKAKGLPTYEGHRHGYTKLKEVVNWAKDAGVSTIVFFAFSEENWNRAEEEVSFMMNLVRDFLKNEGMEAMENNVRLKYIGNLDRFDTDIAQGMRDTEKQTENNTGITVALAVSYGGRQEILYAVNELLKQGKSHVTIEDISAVLYTKGLPDPDIIIRTSGEMRLSGFLPWQGVYSELFFSKTLWPDFSKEEFQQILSEYDERERRFGK